MVLHGQTPSQIAPGTPETAYSGAAPAAELCSGDLPPPPRAPFTLGRPIWRQWPRLDRIPARSEPPDRDPTVEICRYRFGLFFLHKSPWTLCYSTRSPLPLKNNYSLAQNFAQTPLSLLNIKPAIQHSFFYALDPRFIL